LLEFVLGLAVCAFTAAGHDSPEAVAQWAAGCLQETLAVLGGRRDPWTRRIRPPSVRTFARVFERIDAEAFNAAVPPGPRRATDCRACWSRPPRMARPSAVLSALTAARCTCCRCSTWPPGACAPSGRMSGKLRRPEVGPLDVAGGYCAW
jgi:hypothetical protein